MSKEITPIDRHIAGKMKTARDESGISQEKLAELLGLTTMQVYKYETAKNRISAGRLYTVAVLLGKPVAWFFPS